MIVQERNTTKGFQIRNMPSISWSCCISSEYTRVQSETIAVANTRLSKNEFGINKNSIAHLRLLCWIGRFSYLCEWELVSERFFFVLGEYAPQAFSPQNFQGVSTAVVIALLEYAFRIFGVASWMPPFLLRSSSGPKMFFRDYACDFAHKIK